jgi:Fibronectin type III domain
MTQARSAAAVALLTLVIGFPLAADELEEAKIYLEQNVTDADAEIVIVAQGGDEGLKTLEVIGPNGRHVLTLWAGHKRTLGFREVLLETPEPSLAIVKKAYPPGVYRFVAKTFSGEELTGEAELEHAMPAAATILVPANGAEDVAADHLVVSWEPVAGVASYLLEIEQDDLGQSINLTLPADVTSFAVPDGWLQPGVEYELGVATVSESGNLSFQEIAFTTAP